MSAAHFVLALSRDRRAPSQIHREAGPQALHQASAWYWTNEAMPVVTIGDGSIVIGHCFSRERVSTRHNPLVHSGDATAYARSLLRTHWGAYLAVLRDERGGCWQVMSDPSGLLPVFRIVTSDQVILSSDPALLEQVLRQKLQVCWNSVLNHLRRPDQRQRGTCLSGVDELPPGVLLDPSMPEASERALWKPSDHFPSDPLPTFELARAELRAVAIDVLAAWQEALGPVAVAVSGGVDSSFICGALAAGQHEFGCITLATAEASGDERHFARLLAGHLGRPLQELTYDPAILGPDSLASRGLPRPSRRTFVFAVDRMLAYGAKKLGAAVVFDGNVGDNLFCYLYSAVPVADRLRAEGPAPGALSTLLDMCRVTGCDFSTMARATLRELLGGNRAPTPNCDMRFLSSDASGCEDGQPLTQWLSKVDGPHKGKRDHIALILRGQHNVHGISSRAPRLSPLLSQPLLETCLKIPTWHWPTGGINRALARSALATELPAELSTRKAKPGPDSFIRRAYERNKHQLHAMLRDGLLASNGLLDLVKLDQAFVGDAPSDWNDARRVLDLAEAENWAKSWQA
jgi:asparagine synthase (glutamine-hydrolysing)